MHDERKRIAGYTPFLSIALDSLAGMVQAVDHDAVRIWTDQDNKSLGLGDVDVPATPAARLWRNADGDGMSWRSFWNCVAIDLLKYSEAYILAEGIETDEGVTIQEPRLRLIPPVAVRNEVYSGNRATERLVHHIKDVRKSVREDQMPVDHWTLYSMDGWEEYREDDDGNPIVTDSGTYDYVMGGRQTLPIFKLEMPMHRHPAYMAARQCNRIFNLESEQQIGTRMGNLARLALVTSAEEFSEIVAKLAEGHNVLRQPPESTRDHHYVAPPTGPGELAGTIIERYTNDFQATTFQVYSQSLKSVTATEIRQKSRTGVEALLVTLTDVLDRGENTALRLLEQAERPGKPDQWDHAFVERSRKFQPIDGVELVQTYKDMFFDGAVKLGITGKTRASVKIANELGVEVDEDEVEQEIREEADQRTQDNDALRNFGLE